MVITSSLNFVKHAEPGVGSRAARPGPPAFSLFEPINEIIILSVKIKRNYDFFDFTIIFDFCIR